MNILIKQARVIDPANKFDKIADLLLKNGKIEKIAAEINVEGAKVIEAKGFIAAPGLIDMHTHLRQPGREDEETFETASKAAAKGGFTSICAMPNTDPISDNRGAIEYIISESQKTACVNIFAIGALTVGEKGEEMAEIMDMKKAGIVALSDDGHPVKNSQLMRKVLEYARMAKLPVISHCEDMELTAGGVMNEGLNSTMLGMRGIPNASEAVVVARDILLAELTGARLHIAHVSTKESIRIIREAKKRGVNVTAETCPHYFSLTDDAIKTFNANYKVNPPLRAKEDLKEIKEALKDNTIDLIATDHAPHAEAEKDVEFDYAASGMIGLETALSISIMELVNKGALDISALIRKMSVVPAQLLGLDKKGSLSIGNDADIVIIDPNAEWIYEKSKILSKSKNSPFIGETLKAKALYTIRSGKIVYQDS